LSLQIHFIVEAGFHNFNPPIFGTTPHYFTSLLSHDSVDSEDSVLSVLPVDFSVSSVVVVSVESVTLADVPDSLEEGEEVQLRAIVLPENATDKGVTWAVFPEENATISASGLLTGVAAGSVTVVVTSKSNTDKKDSKEVTVTAVSGPQEVVLESISVTAPQAYSDTFSISAIR